MKRLAIVLAACASCARPTSTPNGPTAPTETTAPGTTAPSTEQAAAGSRDCPPPTTPDAKTTARRAELIAEIDRLDRELDAIDGELAAAAQNSGRTLFQARADALERKAMLTAFSADAPGMAAGTPRMLVRAVHELHRGLLHKLELARELGPAHPDMVLMVRRIEYLRRTVSAQLDAEKAFAQAWFDLLTALPTKAKADEIYKTRLRALQATIATGPSSDSPAAVQLAVERLNELAWTHAELVDVVGPKHPEMIAVTVRIKEATTAKATALAAADADLAARIRAPTRTPDTSLIARRSELADAARELRREYELLLER